jgi:predicted dienelactone hydrolase
MKFIFNLIIFFCIAFSNAYAFERKTLDMFDGVRGRNVPVVIYQGETINKQVVIISHGYGAKNTEYSFIANALAARGYFVASIQHDLVTDACPKTGTLWERRKPF